MKNSFLNKVVDELELNMSGTSSDAESKNYVSITSKIRPDVVVIYLLGAFTVSALLSATFCSPLENFDGEVVAKLNFKLVIVISIIINVVVLIYGLLKRFILLKKYQPKPINFNTYNRELPSNLTPAHVRVLVQDGLVDSKTLASTIMDLVDRKYLILENEKKEDLFKKNIVLKIANRDLDELFGYEKYIIEWFFGDNETITGQELRQKLRNEIKNPYIDFNIFQALVLLSFPFKEMYNKRTNPKMRGIYTTCFCLFFVFFLLGFVKNIYFFIFCNFVPLYGFVNIMFANPNYILNQKGSDLKDSYLDFKRFLEDFSEIGEKSSEMISLWNFYLSYSIALDVKSVAYDEIGNFFGDTIYMRNSYLMVRPEEEKFIQNMNEEIKKSEELYLKRANK